MSPKDAIVEYLTAHSPAKATEISDLLGLKASRTRDYLSQLVSEGKITAEGENRLRTYSIKKKEKINGIS